MDNTQSIGILGVGNLLLADEGFGVHAINRLQERYIFPKNVEILDGGTAGIMLSPFIESKDILFVIDVVNMEAPAGTVYEFSSQDLNSGTIQPRMSPHQVGLLEILDLCQLRGKAPSRVELIATVPADLSTRIGLSPALLPVLDKVIERLLQRLQTFGIMPKCS